MIATASHPTSAGPMAKKRSTKPTQPDMDVRRVHPSENRRQLMSVDDLLKDIEKARGFIASTEQTLLAAQREGIESFIIDGATKLTRATILLSEFSSAVTSGANAARLEL